jgi:CHAT domain-containing protein
MSACETALTTDTRLLDESIHLAAAFQLAGYPNVVGTLWAIDDHSAVEIAETFYRAPTAEFDADGVALALHRSVRTVRDRFPVTPSLWAAHIHAGAQRRDLRAAARISRLVSRRCA